MVNFLSLQDKCEGAGFYNRLTLLEQQFKGTAVLLHKMGHLAPGFRQLWADERLLNVVEQFIGPDIAGELLYWCPTLESSMYLALQNNHRLPGK